MINNIEWDHYYLGIAKAVALKSKDPSTKVGCVIVRPDHSLVSTGFNGFPRRMGDDPSLIMHRDSKLERTVHAELNALLFAREPLDGHTMYCSLYPCSHCALHIIQAGIARLVSPAPSHAHAERWKDSFDKTRTFFAETQVQVTMYAS